MEQDEHRNSIEQLMTVMTGHKLITEHQLRNPIVIGYNAQCVMDCEDNLYVPTKGAQIKSEYWLSKWALPF